MNQPINHTNIDEIVCPWCGYPHDKATTYSKPLYDNSAIGKWICNYCVRRFTIDRTYTTDKLTNEDELKININREGKNVDDTTNAGPDRPDMGRR